MISRAIGKFVTSAVTGLALSFSGAFAAEYPSETIRVIVPYKPGGGTDSIGRAFAAALEEVSGQAVIVENIPGSAGINGILALKKAKPDGYTISLFGASDVAAPIAFREDAPFAAEDFSCAGSVFNTPVWVLAHKNNGYSDLGGFLDDAKANPGKLVMGITDKNTATDFVASTLKGTSGLDFRIVGFGGGGPLKKAVLANQVNVGLILAPVLLAEVKAGELNALAASGGMQGINHAESQALKHVRTWGADIDVGLVRGIWMPSGVPEDVRAKMEGMVKASLESETFKSFGDSFGFAPFAETGAELCARLPKEINDLKTVLTKYTKD
jgi:tripartite-type tricarboxylate transporter receptor subunit TctC